MKFLIKKQIKKNNFVRFIKCIQENYRNLYLSAIATQFKTEYAICEPYYDEYDLDEFEYAQSQCFRTTEFLSFFFLGEGNNKKIPNLLYEYDSKYNINDNKPNLHSLFNEPQNSDDDLFIYDITFGGTKKIPGFKSKYVLYADHSFLLLKNRGKFYICQSFFNVYSFNSLYGFLKLSRSEFENFSELLQQYADSIYIDNYVSQYVNRLNDRFEYFVGVNLKKHMGFMGKYPFYDDDDENIQIPDNLNRVVMGSVSFGCRMYKFTLPEFEYNVKMNVENLLNHINLSVKEKKSEKYLKILNLNNKIDQVNNQIQEIIYDIYDINDINENTKKLKLDSTPVPSLLPYYKFEFPTKVEFNMNYMFYDCFTDAALFYANQYYRVSTNSVIDPCQLFKDIGSGTNIQHLDSNYRRNVLKFIELLSGYDIYPNRTHTGNIDVPRCENSNGFYLLKFSRNYNIDIRLTTRLISDCFKTFTKFDFVHNL